MVGIVGCAVIGEFPQDITRPVQALKVPADGMAVFYIGFQNSQRYNQGAVRLKVGHTVHGYRMGPAVYKIEFIINHPGMIQTALKPI